MADADGEATETQVWLDFARDCGYMAKERQEELKRSYEEVGRMLWRHDCSSGEIRTVI